MRHLKIILIGIVALCSGCSTWLSPVNNDLESSMDNNLDLGNLHQKTQQPNNEVPSISMESRQNSIYRPPSTKTSNSGGKHITMQFNQVPLSVFKQVFTELIGENIVTHHSVSEQLITTRINDMPWQEALRISMQIHDMQVQYQNGVVVIMPFNPQQQEGIDPLLGMYTDLFKLSYAEPDQIKDIITPLFADADSKPSLSVDRRVRALIVQGTEEQLKLTANLIQQLDVPIKQVRIEAFIVEAEEDFERSLGTRLGINRLDTKDALRVAGVAGGKPAVESGVALGSDSGVAINLPIPNAYAGIGFLFDSGRLKLELTALENQGKLRIVSNPKVFTLDNQEAIIFQGDEVPYFTVSENGTQTQFKEAGIRLAVTPGIIGNDSLMLDIEVNKDTVDTRIDNPPITRRQVSTKLKMADGAMVVIGGIYFNTKLDTVAKVPGLSRIPVIGKLFHRQRKERDVKELLVFIAPKIID